MKYDTDKVILEAIRIASTPASQLITEMAIPLKDYRAKVDGLRFQLVQNWCLCDYCHLYDKENLNFHHWLVELQAVIDQLKNTDIKGNVDKHKILTKMLVVDYDYTKPAMIERITRGKFGKEGINSVKQRVHLCNEFAGEIEKIINLIAEDAFITDDYLATRFGVG